MKNEIKKENIPAIHVEVRMKETFGTESAELSTALMHQIINAYPLAYSNRKPEEVVRDSLVMLNGIAPKDELEGLLAVQMISTHNMAMDFMRRSMLANQTAEGVDFNVNRASKLLRTFTQQMEALTRYRTKGQQQLTVQHVQVNSGGQAIVGNVHTSKGGGKCEEEKR